MKVLTIAVCLFLCNCDRNPRSVSGRTQSLSENEVLVSSPSRLAEVHPENPPIKRSVDNKVWELVGAMTKGGEEARRAISDFRSLASTLNQEGIFAAAIERVPLPFRNDFVDLLVPIFQKKRERHEFDAEYLISMKLLNNSPMQPKPEELLEDLNYVPPYVFPKDNPNPWDAGSAVHAYKGYPGQIALALVNRNDTHTFDLYKAALENAERDLRQV